MSEEKTVQLLIKIRPKLKEALKAHADKKHSTMSAIVKKLILKEVMKK